MSGRNGSGADLINGTMGDLEMRGFDIGSQVINQQITQNSSIIDEVLTVLEGF